MPATRSLKHTAEAFSIGISNHRIFFSDHFEATESRREGTDPTMLKKSLVSDWFNDPESCLILNGLVQVDWPVEEKDRWKKKVDSLIADFKKTEQSHQ